MTREQAAHAVLQVLVELDGRRGFAIIDQLRSDDPEVFFDLLESCIDRVQRNPTFSPHWEPELEFVLSPPKGDE